MKEAFITKKFPADHAVVIRQANEIIRDYAEQGYDLTLRQLYYQFVAKDAFPDKWAVDLGGGQLTKNHERNYKKLGTILNDARMAGLVDWDAIVDRTRELNEWQHAKSVAQVLHDASKYFALDMWESQPWVVEVWIEKQALAGIFNRVCAKWDVPYFSCRGYVSASATYEAYQRIFDRISRGQGTLILHFGDHDPSGVDMTRDVEVRLRQMLGSHEGTDFEDLFDVRRLALNMDQIRAMRPPPSPAKITDSRCADYVAKFGEDSWELDALDPSKLTELADTEIQRCIDWDEWETTKADQAKGRARLAELSAKEEKR